MSCAVVAADGPLALPVLSDRNEDDVLDMLGLDRMWSPRPVHEPTTVSNSPRRFRNGRGPDLDPTTLGATVSASAFILDEPENVPAVWGDDEHVLWAAGEPLYIVGPAGVGKTTLCQQLALKRHGIGQSELLGHAVAVEPKNVLYVAADRPRQAARSFRRMVSPSDRQGLDCLKVWRGPLPFNLADHPQALLELAHANEAGTVVIDSLKDVALDLSKDETGSVVNHALQHLVAANVEVCVLHHQRKAGADNRAPRSLADVYGSTWLTAGAGSVVLLWGEPGDPIVELRHLKHPAEEIGPLKLAHDHARGTTRVHEAADPLKLLRQADAPITAQDLARSTFEVAKPTAAQVEKSRRQLERLAGAGMARRHPANPPDPVRYSPGSVPPRE